MTVEREFPAARAAPQNQTAVDFEHSGNLAEFLNQLGISLLVSTYQAGKVLSVGCHSEKVGWEKQTLNSFPPKSKRGSPLAAALNFPSIQTSRRSRGSCPNIQSVGYIEEEAKRNQTLNN
ncbi:MAG TPA: hypothetical protein VMM76_26275 [Pirellulaceae bacterium]|nr:hypothetical protein [Pirellulaceae bacterium]